MSKVAEMEVGADRAAMAPRQWRRTAADFFRGVINAGLGAPIPDHLKPFAVAGTDETSGLSGAVGGFLVPQSVAPMLLRRAYSDPAAGRTTEVPMATPIVSVPARTDKDHTTTVTGGVTVIRRQETLAITNSRLQMESVTLDAHASTIALVPVSEELIADSAVSIGPMLEATTRDALNDSYMEERLRGQAGALGQGILSSAALISIPRDVGQVAATVSATNITGMVARLWPGCSGVCWIANSDLRAQLMTLVVSVGVGGTVLELYQFAEADGEPDRLAGYPIFYHESASAIGSLGDISLVGWSEFLDGIYQDVTGIDSMFVRYEVHEREFKFWTRRAFAPWWKAPLTPKRSTTTLSPYVTLAARP